MKKVCVLLTGEMRTNPLSDDCLTTESVIESMATNIFNSRFKTSFESEVFIATDCIDVVKAKEFFGDTLKNIHISKQNIRNPNTSLSETYLTPLVRRTPPIEYFLKLYDKYDLDGNDSFKYQVYQFYRALCCFNLVEDYTKYDYIVLLRPDLIYYNNFLDMFDLLEQNKECHLVGNLNYYAVGRPHIMKHYCELSYKFGSYNKNKLNFDIRGDNICSLEFFNDPDTKRWTFSPEIQLACHLYIYCITNKLPITKTLMKIVKEPDVLIVRHWMIDKCNICYVCNNGLAEKDELYRHFKITNNTIK